MFKHLRNYFLTGLFVLLPILASILVLVWAFHTTDAILGVYLPKKYPGVGLVTLLCLIILVGVLAQNYVGKKLISFSEKIFNRIPILNGLYNLFKQIADVFSHKEQNAFRRMVLVEYPRKGILSPGFLTGDAPAEISSTSGRKFLSIFVPTVPNPTTGFLIYVPEDEVTMLEMSIEEGIKLIISAGVIRPEYSKVNDRNDQS